MAEIVSEMVITMSAVTGGDVVATVDVQGTDLDDVIATATVDGTAGAAAQGNQRVAMAVAVNGSEVDETLLLAGTDVARDYTTTQQSGRFAVPLEAGGVGQFGSPYTCAGPPTGKQTISIYGVYETSTGRHLVPVITGGIADTSSRSDAGGYIESFQFLDRGARFDRTKVSVTFPPGHGFRRDEMARAILERAGETDFRFEEMNQSMKELSLAKAEPENVVQGSLMDIEHRRLLWDHNGEAWNPQVGPPRADEPIAWTFEADDIYDRDPVNVTHRADVITKVIADGMSQELLDTCDPVTENQSIRTDAIYAPHRPSFAQSASSMYAANPAEVVGEDPILVELKVIETTTRCGTIVRTVTKTYAWKNPEIARYEWDATGDEWDTLGNVFTEVNSDTDDPAYAFDVEKWALVSVEDNREYYFQTGFQLPWSSGQYEELAYLQYPFGYPSAALDDDGQIIGAVVGSDVVSGIANVKLGTWRKLWGYYAPRAAIKTRSISSVPYDDWDAVEPTNGAVVLGNKEAVQIVSTTNPSLVRPETLNFGANGEMLILTSEDIEILAPDVTGKFLIGRTVHSHGWDVRPGGVQYFFHEDLKSNEELETFRKFRSVSEDFVGVGEDQHNIIRTAYDRDGREIDGEPDELGLGGYLPGIDRLPDTSPDESLYENDVDVLTKHREARRRDQKQIRVEVEAVDLLTCHVENEVEATLEWAENEDELEFAARMMIAESAAAVVTFTLAGLNAFLRETEIVHLTYSPLGLNHDLRVVSVSHSGGYPEGPLLTRVSCLLFGWS